MKRMLLLWRERERESRGKVKGKGGRRRREKGRKVGEAIVEKFLILSPLTASFPHNFNHDNFLATFHSGTSTPASQLATREVRFKKSASSPVSIDTFVPFRPSSLSLCL